MSKKSKNPNAWVGVALDGVLAKIGPDTDAKHIGEPVPAMVELVKRYLERGIQVKIVTPRIAQAAGDNDIPSAEASNEADEVYLRIKEWLEMHIGHGLPITAATDMDMIVLYSDRCIQVEQNTGVAMVDYYQTAADTMNQMLEDIRGALGVAHQKDIMGEIRRLVK